MIAFNISFLTNKVNFYLCTFFYHWHYVFFKCVNKDIIINELQRHSRDSIRWLYSSNKSSYIRSVYSQCHVELFKCIDQNGNNQAHTQISQLYVHVSVCLKVIRSWLNLPTGGHGHVICIGGIGIYSDWFTPNIDSFINICSQRFTHIEMLLKKLSAPALNI